MDTTYNLKAGFQHVLLLSLSLWYLLLFFESSKALMDLLICSYCSRVRQTYLPHNKLLFFTHRFSGAENSIPPAFVVSNQSSLASHPFSLSLLHGIGEVISWSGSQSKGQQENWEDVSPVHDGQCRSWRSVPLLMVTAALGDWLRSWWLVLLLVVLAALDVIATLDGHFCPSSSVPRVMDGAKLDGQCRS